MRLKCVTAKEVNLRTRQEDLLQIEMKEPEPWVMWWACLASVDEFD